MREIASFITNRLGNAIYFLSTTQPRCWMFQRGRSSVMKLYLWQSNSRSHEVSLVWVRLWLAAHTHLTQGVCNYMADTKHGNWHLEAIYHGRGKADAAQSVTQSSLSGGRGVRHGTTQSVMESQQNKSQNWSKYQGWKEIKQKPWFASAIKRGSPQGRAGGGALKKTEIKMEIFNRI